MLGTNLRPSEKWAKVHFWWEVTSKSWVGSGQDGNFYFLVFGRGQVKKYFSGWKNFWSKVGNSVSGNSTRHYRSVFHKSLDPFENSGFVHCGVHRIGHTESQ
jgi:hypothetical protein